MRREKIQAFGLNKSTKCQEEWMRRITVSDYLLPVPDNDKNRNNDKNRTVDSSNHKWQKKIMPNPIGMQEAEQKK